MSIIAWAQQSKTHKLYNSNKEQKHTLMCFLFYPLSLDRVKRLPHICDVTQSTIKKQSSHLRCS